jgi:hypothetical protein
MDYSEACDVLGTRNGRKIGNNTYLERLGDDAIGVRLHSTYVITLYADGSVELDSGGWETVTTKERMNRYSGARIFAEKHVWYVVTRYVMRHDPGKTWIADDGKEYSVPAQSYSLPDWESRVPFHDGMRFTVETVEPVAS